MGVHGVRPTSFYREDNLMTLSIKDAITQVSSNGTVHASREARRTIVQYAIKWVDDTWDGETEQGKAQAVKGKVNAILVKKCFCSAFGKDAAGWAQYRSFADGLIPEPTQAGSEDTDDFLASIDMAD